MNDDTISRSTLVAELEAYKISLGDIVLRFVVDRVIDLVKAQKTVKAVKGIDVCAVPKIMNTDRVEFRGIAWIPDTSPSESVARAIEDILRQGWKPCSWSYEFQTPTDHRYINYLFMREVQK